jgi:hypothetical protein
MKEKYNRNQKIITQILIVYFRAFQSILMFNKFFEFMLTDQCVM